MFNAIPMQGDGIPGKEPPDGGGGVKDMNEGKKAKVSFKDMVIGSKTVHAPRPKVDLYKEKLSKNVYEDGYPQKPMVHIDESVFEGFYAPWQDALVVSLLDKTIGYNTMKDKLTRLWKLSAGFDIMDIGSSFYMVKFEEEVDREKVMDEGPWMIFYHYVTVQTWTPDFISPKANIESGMDSLPWFAHVFR